MICFRLSLPQTFAISCSRKSPSIYQKIKAAFIFSNHPRLIFSGGSHWAPHAEKGRRGTSRDALMNWFGFGYVCGFCWQQQQWRALKRAPSLKPEPTLTSAFNPPPPGGNRRQSTIWDFTVKREHNHANWKPIKDLIKQDECLYLLKLETIHMPVIVITIFFVVVFTTCYIHTEN